MDHDEVVRSKMTERYLLHELDPEQRDAFEEHFFDCQACALDVRAASMFVEQSKIVLAEDAGKAAVPAPASVGVGWFAWLRPSFAVPALALLLVVIGYQNFVTYPQLEQAYNRPHLLPWASINTRTRGASTPVIAVPRGGSFLLFVNIPPDGGYSRYIADLYNPAGKVEWSLVIPASSVQDQWPIQVPGTNREAGNYTVAVDGVTAAGESKEIGRAPFELQIQK
jgi:Putative zinc-finger